MQTKTTKTADGTFGPSAVLVERSAALDKESKKLFVVITENIFVQPTGYNAEFVVLAWYYPKKI